MNNGPIKMSGPWKKYEHEKKRQLPAIAVGDRFSRLTVTEVRLKKGFGGYTHEIVCRCECNALVVVSPQSLRKGHVKACKADMKLEKKYSREIAMAKELEAQTSPHLDPSELPSRPKWEFAGAEDELITAQEKQEAAT